MPRRSCGSRSVSVADNESNSAAASSSPGDCAYTTRVSESDRSPCASATCSESDAPTERRSETRCNTATFETPKARESFQDDCSQRATPKFERIAQASSTTRKKRPRSGWTPFAETAVRASAACNQAVAHAIRTPRAADEYSADKSRTTSGEERSKPGVVGPSNIPRRSPCTSRRNSNATSRPSSRRSRRSVRNERAASAVGVSRASTTTGTVGTATDRVDSARAAPSAARSRGTRSASETGTGEGGEQLHPPTPAGVRPRGSVDVGTRVERIEADGTTRTQRHGPDTPRVSEVAVLALGVDDPGPAPEHGLTPQEGLDEGALSTADLPEHHHVGIGHHPGRVELERVEDEGAAQQVVADDDATSTEARLRNERVRRAEVPRGHLVGRDTRHSFPHGG